MNKLAIASIVLLIAGMGLALGDAGSCTCPNSQSCAKTGCLDNCKGSCAAGNDAASSCTCPNSESCAKTGCLENCKGSCALGADAASSCTCPNGESCAKIGCFENCKGSCAIGNNAASSCAASCSKANCESADKSKSRCAFNSAPACVC